MKQVKSSMLSRSLLLGSVSSAMLLASSAHATNYQFPNAPGFGSFPAALSQGAGDQLTINANAPTAAEGNSYARSALAGMITVNLGTNTFTAGPLGNSVQ